MNRILVRAPNWIGDQIMAYPFYRLLREAYPKAWIAVVCTEWVRDIQYRGLVDDVFVIPKKKDDGYFRSFRTLKQFAKRLRESGPWDLGISLPNSFGSAMLFALARVKERRGYDTDARGWLLTEKVRWDSNPDIHRAQAYINLLTREPKLLHDVREYWGSAPEKQFDSIRYWPDIVPIEPPRESYFVIAPGATADSRRWSVDQFSDLIEKIHDQFGFTGVVVGGNAEREIASQFLKRGLPIEDFTGKGWVSAHWKLFSRAQFTICNESGLAHVAALCGSKVQIICGAADPKRTRPIGPGRVQVTINPVECWPCERNQCKFVDERKNQCLNGISPDRVLKEIESGFFARD